jgi:hypothetical protein
MHVILPIQPRFFSCPPLVFNLLFEGVFPRQNASVHTFCFDLLRFLPVVLLDFMRASSVTAYDFVQSVRLLCAAQT